MTLQREVKHLKMKDAKRCGKKRKATPGNLHWSGDDHSKTVKAKSFLEDSEASSSQSIDTWIHNIKASTSD